MDTGRERSATLAVDDDYEPPKSGVARSSAGIVGAVVLTSAIVLAGVYAAGTFTDFADSAMLEPTEDTEPVVAARSVDVPFMVTPAARAPEAPDAGAEDAEADAEADDEEQPEQVSGAESQATEPDRPARPKPRAGARRQAARAPAPEPAAPKDAGASTALPQPKPPPDFDTPSSPPGEIISDDPYADEEPSEPKEKPEPPSDSKWGF